MNGIFDTDATYVIGLPKENKRGKKFDVLEPEFTEERTMHGWELAKLGITSIEQLMSNRRIMPPFKPGKTYYIFTVEPNGTRKYWSQFMPSLPPPPRPPKTPKLAINTGNNGNNGMSGIEQQPAPEQHYYMQNNNEATMLRQMAFLEKTLESVNEQLRSAQASKQADAERIVGVFQAQLATVKAANATEIERLSKLYEERIEFLLNELESEKFAHAQDVENLKERYELLQSDFMKKQRDYYEFVTNVATHQKAQEHIDKNEERIRNQYKLQQDSSGFGMNDIVKAIPAVKELVNTLWNGPQAGAGQLPKKTFDTNGVGQQVQPQPRPIPQQQTAPQPTVQQPPPAPVIPPLPVKEPANGVHAGPLPQ